MASETWRAISRPWRPISSRGSTGKPEKHQPPLRPDAPNPAISFSTTNTFNEGSRWSRWYAVHSPVNPAPMMATSTSVEPSRAGRGVRSSPAFSSQKLYFA